LYVATNYITSCRKAVLPAMRVAPCSCRARGRGGLDMNVATFPRMSWTWAWHAGTRSFRCCAPPRAPAAGGFGACVRVRACARACVRARVRARARACVRVRVRVCLASGQVNARRVAQRRKRFPRRRCSAAPRACTRARAAARAILVVKTSGQTVAKECPTVVKQGLTVAETSEPRCQEQRTKV
jgi:hypothetical protein